MKTPLTTFRFFVAALGLSLLTGCAQNIPFSAAKRTSVKGASVVKRSQYLEKDKVTIYTFGKNLGIALGVGVGGVVGGGIAAAAVASGGDDRSQFAAYLKAQQIDLGLIMAGAFERELRAAPLWPPAKGASDAAFDFKIGVSGLAIRHGFTTKLSPILTAEGKLVRQDGKILWQRSAFSRVGEVQHSLDEYLQKPEVLRAAMDATARQLSREFLGELHVEGGGRDPIAATDRAEEKAAEAREEAREREKEAAEEALDREKDAAKEARKREKEAAKRQRAGS